MDSSRKTSNAQPRCIDYVMDPIDEIFAADERLSSAFGGGIVIYSAADQCEVELPQPENFISNRVKKFESCSSEFSSTEKRIEFVEAAHTAATSQTKVTVRYDSARQIDLSIDPSHIKGYAKWNTGDKILDIPLVKSGWTEKYETMYRAAVITNLERAADIFEGQEKNLDIEQSLKILGEHANRIVANMCTSPSRRRCQEAIISYILTELTLTHKLSNIIKFCVVSTVIQSDGQSGAYVQLSDIANTPKERTECMIQKNSVGYNGNPIYGLNFRQLRQLVVYIFSRDPGERVMAKVNLLSSVPPTVRPDIITGPGRVLIESIHEYFMTREEIVSLVFSGDTERRATRCTHCQTAVIITGLNISHTGCPVTEWLVKHFQFHESETNTTAPQLAYVKPGVVYISKALAEAQRKIRSLPFIGKSDKEAMAYTLDGRGHPKKIGTISRNIPPLPHSYDTRSSRK